MKKSSLKGRCSRIVDKEKRLRCKFELLHEATVKQDLINLNLMRDMDNDKDPRWLPIHIVDNANAMILTISKGKGYPDPAYLDEKANSLSSKMMQYRWMKKEK